MWFISTYLLPIVYQDQLVSNGAHNYIVPLAISIRGAEEEHHMRVSG